MKICHVSTAHSSASSRIFDKFCRSASLKGWDVSYVVGDGSIKRQQDSVQIIPFKKASGRFDRFFNHPRRALKLALNEQADIYQLHDPELLQIVGRLKKAGKKVIFDFHEDVPLQILSKAYVPKKLRVVVASFYKKYQDYVVLKLDSIITATETITEKIFVPGIPTATIFNYPNQSFLGPLNGWEMRQNVVIYIGGLSEHRGVYEFVKAIEYCSPNIEFVICGDFVSKDFKNRVTSLKGWERVTFFGFVDKIKIINELQKAKLGIVTLHPTANYVEALPIKMFEYMSQGIPVIASNFPLWKNILEKYKFGVITDPMSPKAIAAEINKMFEQEGEMQKMGQAGRTAIELNLNWDTQFEKAHMIYENLVANNTQS